MILIFCFRRNGSFRFLFSFSVVLNVGLAAASCFVLSFVFIKWLSLCSCRAWLYRLTHLLICSWCFSLPEVKSDPVCVFLFGECVCVCIRRQPFVISSHFVSWHWLLYSIPFHSIVAHWSYELRLCSCAVLNSKRSCMIWILFDISRSWFLCYLFIVSPLSCFSLFSPVLSCLTAPPHNKVIVGTESLSNSPNDVAAAHSWRPWEHSLARRVFVELVQVVGFPLLEFKANGSTWAISAF